MAFEVESFLAVTIGIIVYFVGSSINRRIALFREYNIPDSVTGGMLAASLALCLYVISDVALNYDLAMRDILLVYFFTSLGINVRVHHLKLGGWPLLIFSALSLGYLLFQDAFGVALAQWTGQPAAIGVQAGSASLMGGFATSIAWGNEIVQKFGVEDALPIGVAASTFGLILGSVLGGPMAKYLLGRFDLKGNDDAEPIVGISHDKESSEKIDHVSLMAVLLVLHVSIVIGYFLNQIAMAADLRLPLLVACLLTAIFLSNTVPVILPSLHWPSGTKALAVVADLSLGLFVAMSLMSMQLWTVTELAGPLFALIGLQTIAVILFVRFVLFPCLGRNYLAAVLSTGFVGFSLGAIPTAIANMSAVTKSHGAAPLAFIILPLAGALFVNVANTFVIQFFLSQ